MSALPPIVDVWRALLGRVIAEVKGLRIELLFKRLDLRRVHEVCFFSRYERSIS